MVLLQSKNIMEEKIEDIEERIILKMLKKIEGAKNEELSLFVSSYAKFIESISLRKIINEEN